MNFILAEVSATQWIVLALILVLIVLYPFFVMFKNKKEREKFEQLSGSLKVGDKVLTSSGVYGEIISITDEQQGKLVTLKTGDAEHTGFISVDVLAIYNVFHDKPAEEAVDMSESVEENQVVEEKTEEESVPQPQEEEFIQEEPAKKAAKSAKKSK